MQVYTPSFAAIPPAHRFQPDLVAAQLALCPPLLIAFEEFKVNTANQTADFNSLCRRPGSSRHSARHQLLAWHCLRILFQ